MRSQFNTHRLLLFSELRSSPFSAGTLKKKKKEQPKEKSNFVFSTDKK